jgi:hypothetical protein
MNVTRQAHSRAPAVPEQAARRSRRWSGFGCLAGRSCRTVQPADRTRVTSLLHTAAARIAVELAAYPHIAACPVCLEYAKDQPGASSVPITIAATLAHHDSAHIEDYLTLLTLASQHFG